MLGIYCITNKVNNKLYIGKSRDVKRRIRHHKEKLKKNKHHNYYLQNAWNKYGEDAFEFKVVMTLNDYKCLDIFETYFIKANKSNVSDFGYNLTTGGEGGEVNDEIKKKIGVSHRGIKSELSFKDVVRIKSALYCGMNTSDLASIFNVSNSIIKNIRRGATFDYVVPEINQFIKYGKKEALNNRNSLIIKTYSKLRSIKDTSEVLGYSESVIEKCIYKYTNAVDVNSIRQQGIYEDIMRLYKEGNNGHKIHVITGYPLTTIYKYIKGETNPYKELSYKKIKKDEESKIVEMHVAGMQIIDIANIYDVSRGTIEYIINKNKYANTELSVNSK